MPPGAKKSDSTRDRATTDADELEISSIGVHHILSLPSLVETKGWKF